MWEYHNTLQFDSYNVTRHLSLIPHFLLALMGSASFLTMYFLKQSLQTSKIFMTLSLYQVVQTSMTWRLGKAIQILAELRVSIKRIEIFLNLPSSKLNQFRSLTDENHSFVKRTLVSLENASFSWNKISSATGEAESTSPVTNSAEFTSKSHHRGNCLKDINLKVSNGDLIGIVGPSGR